MGLVTKNDGWRLADEVWEQIEPLLPARKPHLLGCHNPRVVDRDVGRHPVLAVHRLPVECARCDRHLLVQLGYRRFHEWAEVGVFEAFWRQGLTECDGIN